MRRYLPTVALVGSIAVGVCGALGVPAAGPAIAARTGAASPAVAPGWPGPKAQYLGRYRLTSSNDAALAHQGQLTVFLRVVPQKGSVLSGILGLHGTDGTNVFYLTSFVHAGARLWATVNLGLYTGPVVGKFIVKGYRHDTMTALFAMKSGATLSLRLVRYSPNPHP